MLLSVSSYSHKDRGGRPIEPPVVSVQESPIEIYALVDDRHRAGLAELIAGLAPLVDLQAEAFERRATSSLPVEDERLTLLGTFRSCHAIPAAETGVLVDRLCAAAVAAGAEPLPYGAWAQLRSRLGTLLAVQMDGGVGRMAVPAASLAVVTTTRAWPRQYQVVLLGLACPDSLRPPAKPPVRMAGRACEVSALAFVVQADDLLT